MIISKQASFIFRSPTKIKKLMKIVYFAQVREAIGHGEEEVALPDNIRTLSDLMRWLQMRGAGYHRAMSDETLCMAVDQEFADAETSLENAREVAFFPPMTGG